MRLALPLLILTACAPKPQAVATSPAGYWLTHACPQPPPAGEPPTEPQCPPDPNAKRLSDGPSGMRGGTVFRDGP